MDRPAAGQACPQPRHVGVTWELLPSGATAGPPDVLPRWGELLREYGTDQAMYQSPEWSALLAEHLGPGEQTALAVARVEGAIVGLAPLHVRRDSLRFATAGRTLYRCGVVHVSVLGGSPLMPASEDFHDGLFAALHAAFPECDGVYLGAVMRGDFLWGYVRESAALRRLYLPQLLDGLRTSYRMPLPDSYAAYLGGLSRKRRHNLGREVRRLREYSRGTLDVVPIDSPAAVPDLLDGVEALARSAGREWVPPIAGGRESVCRWFAGAARRGVLCSYLLRCEGRPVAALVGYRHGDACLLDSALYSRPHARFSPGTLLMHLATEDLIGRGVRAVDFGFGNPSYGSSSTLVSREGAAVVLWRRGLVNRIRRAAHTGFRASTRCIRRVAVGMGLWRNPARVEHAH